MSKNNKNNKKIHKSKSTNQEQRSSSAIARDRFKKIVVWGFILMVISGLVLSMTADPTAILNPPVNA